MILQCKEILTVADRERRARGDNLASKLASCERPRLHPGEHWWGEGPYPELAYRCPACGAEVGEDDSGSLTCFACSSQYPGIEFVRQGTF